MGLLQTFFGGTDLVTNTSATAYNFVQSPGDLWNVTEANVQQKIPATVTVGNLFIKQSAHSGGVGRGYTYKLRKNGVDTGIEVIIFGGSEVQDKDIVNTVVFNAGDKISLSCTPVSGPDGVDVAWSFTAESLDNKTSIIIGGGSNVPSASNTEQNHLQGGGEKAWLTNANTRLQLASGSGTIKNFYAEIASDVGASPNSIVFTILKDGVETALTLTFTTGTTATSDVSNSFTVSGGETLAIRSNPDSTPTMSIVKWGVVFESDVDFEYPVLGGSANNTSGGNTEFNFIGSDSENWSTAEANHVSIGQGNITGKQLYISLLTAPGLAASGKSYVFQPRIDGVNTGLDVTILETATSGSNLVDTFTIADFEEITFQIVPANTPDLTDAAWGMTINTGQTADVAEVALFMGVMS